MIVSYGCQTSKLYISLQNAITVDAQSKERIVLDRSNPGILCLNPVGSIAVYSRFPVHSRGSAVGLISRPRSHSERLKDL
jgi:hypothetical protein